MSDLREAIASAIETLASNDDGTPRPADMHDPDEVAQFVDATLAAIDAAGFTVVPRDATEDMVEAGMAAGQMAGQASGVFGQTIENSWRHEFWHELAIYAAMLDAAPKP